MYAPDTCALCTGAVCPSFYYDRGRSRLRCWSRNGDVARGPARGETQTAWALTYHYHYTHVLAWHELCYVLDHWQPDVIAVCAHANARRRIALGWEAWRSEEREWAMGERGVGWNVVAPDPPCLLSALLHIAGRRSGDVSPVGTAVCCIATVLVKRGRCSRVVAGRHLRCALAVRAKGTGEAAGTGTGTGPSTLSPSPDLSTGLSLRAANPP